MGAISTVTINRVWAMPSRWTFGIKPIAELISRYVPVENEWVDPFAGFTSPAKHRNDLNPDAPVQYHEDARTFVTRFPEIDGFLLDPPYSPRQISECYKSLGLPCGMKETQNAALYADVKNAAAPRIKAGGIAICCGWNSSGFGVKRGFDLVEILLVCHGAAHNDTIVTVERKSSDLFG